MTDNNQTRAKKSNFKPLVWIVGFATVAVVIGVGFWFGSNAGSNSSATIQQSSTSGLAPAPVAGRPAPDFALENVDGETVNLSDFKGQPVIINFWATWCGPCKIEMPHLQAAYEAHQEDGLVILGVNLTERDNPQDVTEFLAEYGLTFPVVLDESGGVAEEYRIFGQPASVFVDQDGIIHQVFQGPINEQFINDRVAELLGS